MDAVSRLLVPGPFTDLYHRIESWREARPNRGPMPAELWQEAALLARRHGINPVARALRLHYYSVKRALERAPRRNEVSHPAFVEVSICPPAAVPSGCLVEMERPDGARMKVQGANQSDLVALSETFWRCRA